MNGFAVVVELEGNADHLITLAGEQSGDNGGIHAPGHGDDNARVLRALGNIKRVQHLFSYPVGVKGQRKLCAGFTLDRSFCPSRARQLLPPARQD
ncbi:hypothetical protein D3C87_1802190 [compost metagenome]